MIEFFRQLMILFRCLGLILANKAKLKKEDRTRLLKSYLKLKTLNILPEAIKKRITKVYFLNHQLSFFDLTTTVALVESIFIENEYFFESKNKKPTIIDLGSNIGLSVIYFKILYPDSLMEAYEADPLTCEVLRKNIRDFGFDKVKVQNLAITNKNGKTNFFVDKNGSGSPLMSTNQLRIKNKTKIQVVGAKLSELITRKVDLLKMDIEGSESEVLKDLDSSRKIEMISQMCIEYHHHIDNKSDNLSSFLKILETNNFGYQVHAGQNSPFELKVFEDIQIFAYRK